jgi:hypothetical protein
MKSKGEVVIYKSPEGKPELEVKLKENTVWLTQKQMSNLFQKDVRTVNEHIKNVYKERELEKNSTIRKSRIVQFQLSRNTCQLIY